MSGSEADLLRQGLYYCLDSLRTDPLPVILICTGAGFGLTISGENEDLGTNHEKGRRRDQCRDCRAGRGG